MTLDATDWAVLAASGAFLAGFHGWLAAPRARTAARATEAGGTQAATVVVEGAYVPDRVVVRAGRPVHLTFDRREDSACTDRVVIPAFGINRELPGFAATTIVFTPTTPGEYRFSCGMGMVHGTLVVEPPGS